MARLVKKLIIEPGPIVSLTLIGLMLLGALLYYRAVTIQRFLEPALAISEPRIVFAKRLSEVLRREFEGYETGDILFTQDSIFVKGTLLLVGAHHMEHEEGPQVFTMLSRAFGSMLEDPETRRYIDMILVSTKVHLTAEPATDKKHRAESLRRAEFIMNALFDANPALQAGYRRYFSATAVASPSPEESEWVEFRIIPSQRLHIEVLQRFQKYVR